jgi:hypothetical protein
MLTIAILSLGYFVPQDLARPFVFIEPPSLTWTGDGCASLISSPVAPDVPVDLPFTQDQAVEGEPCEAVPDSDGLLFN